MPSENLIRLGIALSLAMPAYAATISLNYQFTGSGDTPVISGGFLSLNGTATGSVNGLTSVQFLTTNHVNLSNGLNNGTFKIVFTNGNTLFGNLFENDSQVSLTTSAGPFTQALTITGGTGMFSGATGSTSGGGNIYPTYYVTSGAGTVYAPAAVPEPGSAALMLGGLTLLVLMRSRIQFQDAR